MICLCRLLTNCHAMTNPDFADAVKDNKVSIVRDFLRDGEPPDDYVFFLAICFKANAVLRLLIKAGADLRAVDHPKNGGGTPLMAAVYEKNMQAFRLLLKAGALINQRGFGGRMPIHIAAADGSIAFTRACIAAGATIGMREKITGKTPLMSAAHFGYANVVRLLLKAGANPHPRDKFGRTAREIAVDSGKAKIVELLKEVSGPKKKR